MNYFDNELGEILYIFSSEAGELQESVGGLIPYKISWHQLGKGFSEQVISKGFQCIDLSQVEAARKINPKNTGSGTKATQLAGIFPHKIFTAL